MEQGTKGQQELRHQGHKPAGAGETSKAMAESCSRPWRQKCLKSLSGEREERQDEQHIS